MDERGHGWRTHDPRDKCVLWDDLVARGVARRLISLRNFDRHEEMHRMQFGNSITIKKSLTPMFYISIN